jgi:hypothetical protein
VNDDQKMALVISTTFMTGWLPAALYGHPGMGVVFGAAAVMLQIVMALACGDE